MLKKKTGFFRNFNDENLHLLIIRSCTYSLLQIHSHNNNKFKSEIVSHISLGTPFTYLGTQKYPSGERKIQRSIVKERQGDKRQTFLSHIIDCTCNK